MSSQEEKRGYAKGYAAGLRKGQQAKLAGQSAGARRRAENRMWREVFSSALNGLLNSPRKWVRGGKDWNCLADYVQGAAECADHAVARHSDRAL